jgi:hypothetical protein
MLSTSEANDHNLLYMSIALLMDSVLPPPMRQVVRLTLAALMSSSAKHSAMVLMLRNAASRAPVQSNQMAWLTRLNGETSTA